MLRWCLAEQPDAHGPSVLRVRARRRACLQGRRSRSWRARTRASTCTWSTAARARRRAGRATTSTPAMWTSTCSGARLPHGRHQFYVCGPPAMMAEPGAGAARLGRARAGHPLRGLRPGLGAPRRPGAQRAPARHRDRARGAASPLRPHAGLGRAGRQPARLRRAPRRGGGVRLPLGQLRQLRDPARLRHGALRRASPTTTSRRAIACCASARRSPPWCWRPDAMQRTPVQPRGAAVLPGAAGAGGGRAADRRRCCTCSTPSGSAATSAFPARC